MVVGGARLSSVHQQLAEPSGVTAITAGVLAVLGGLAAVPLAVIMALALGLLGVSAEVATYCAAAIAVQGAVLVSGAIRLFLRHSAGRVMVIAGCVMAIVEGLAGLAVSVFADRSDISATRGMVVLLGLLSVLSILAAILTLVLAIARPTVQWIAQRAVFLAGGAPPAALSPMGQWYPGVTAPASSDVGWVPVENTVRLTVVLETADLVDGFMARRAVLASAANLWQGGLGLLTLIVGTLICVNNGYWLPLAFLVTVGALVVLGLLFPRLGFRWLANAALKHNRRLMDGTVTVADDGFGFTTDLSQSKVNWSHYQRYVETSRSFVLLGASTTVAGSSVTVLPKRTISEPADLDRLRAILGRHLPASAA